MGQSSDELNKDDFSDVATILLSERSKQNHQMNGPLMKVLKRGNDNHDVLTLSDLLDKPLESVNRSWERFQVCFSYMFVACSKCNKFVEMFCEYISLSNSSYVSLFHF